MQYYFENVELKEKSSKLKRLKDPMVDKKNYESQKFFSSVVVILIKNYCFSYKIKNQIKMEI